MVALVIGIVLGGLVAIGTDWIVGRFGRERVLIWLYTTIRDRALRNDRVNEQIMREFKSDPFLGRDYARPDSSRRPRDTVPA